MSKEIKTARNGGYKLAALLALAAAFAASGDEWYVDPVNGLDTRDGTTSNVVSATVGPRKTLEYAMKLVGAGDTLWLLPGEYNEGSMNSGRARIVRREEQR